MARDYDHFLVTQVGAVAYVPLPEVVTGILIGDLVDFEAAIDGSLIPDPVATLGLTLVEVDATLAPGLHYFRLTPPTTGLLFFRFKHTSHIFTYSIQVEDPSDLSGLEAGQAVLLGGAGSNVVTIRVVDSGGAPLAGVGVTIRDAYDTLIAVGLTGENGIATFLLGAGTYQVYLRKAGSSLIFTNPYSLTVAGDTSVEYTATSPPFASPGDPTRARVYGWVSDLGLAPQEGVKVIFTLKESNVALSSGHVLGDPIEVLTDDAGFFEVELPIHLDLVPSNVRYLVSIEEAFKHAGWRKCFDAECLEAGGSYSLADLCR